MFGPGNVSAELTVFQGYDYLTTETEFPLGARELGEHGKEGWKLVTVVTLAERKYIHYLTYFIRPKRRTAKYAHILAKGDMST